ncbi:hypothetical protein ACSFA8_26480 [Variovorax sp. RT4R15]|uniref:hypothetical protein n=1 Tax=Variovorax sp. RT4R15 TaxID=3443737 RepID=UPI003F473BF0
MVVMSSFLPVQHGVRRLLCLLECNGPARNGYALPQCRNEQKGENKPAKHCASLAERSGLSEASLLRIGVSKRVK